MEHDEVYQRITSILFSHLMQQNGKMPTEMGLVTTKNP